MEAMVVRRRHLAACLCLLIITTGCTIFGPKPEPTSPLTLSYIHIYEGRHSGVTDTTYLGSIFFPYCIENGNRATPSGNMGGFWFRARLGYDAHAVPIRLLRLGSHLTVDGTQDAREDFLVRHVRFHTRANGNHLNALAKPRINH